MQIQAEITKVCEEVDLRTREVVTFVVVKLLGTEAKVPASKELIEKLFESTASVTHSDEPHGLEEFLEQQNPVARGPRAARSLGEAIGPPSPSFRGKKVVSNAYGYPVVSGAPQPPTVEQEDEEDYDEAPSI